MKKQNKLRQTQSRRTCGNVSKMLQETCLQSSLKNYAQVHLGQNLLYAQRMVTPNHHALLFWTIMTFNESHSHSGYIGVGMLSGAVAGAVFASPPPGILLIMKNYTGDRLNFGIAVEQARSQGAQVDMVIVADVCLSPCSVPGCLPSFQLPPGEMELGLGIHGEPGIKRSKVASADEVVKTISHMTDSSNKSHLSLKSGDKVVLCVNNLGALSCLEIAVVSKAAVHCLEERGMLVVRVMSGPFMTSLEMARMSLSLMKVDEEMLRLFDAKTTAPAWPNLSTASVSGRNLKKNLLHTSSTQWCCSTGLLSSVIRLVLESVCRILMQHQEERAAGDGDCGSTHALIANGMAQTSRIPGNLGQLLADLALLVQERMGGSSGALHCLFLSVALKQNCDGAAWAKALHAGTEAMKRYGGSGPWYLDALCPAAEELMKLSTAPPDGHITILQSAVEQILGAESTRNLTARAGRASYVASQHLTQPDPGAVAVTAILKAILNALKA
uniref:Triokinase/FMN cyclase n=1 Tax=Sinocyclocheilus grahami TaxID=75366 RepID=A0A672JYY9_SINGR